MEFIKGQYLLAKFATANKQNTLADYRRECAKPQSAYCDIIEDNAANWELAKCIVSDVVEVWPDVFDKITSNLLEDYDWLVGKGGSCYPGYEHLFAGKQQSELREVVLGVLKQGADAANAFREAHHHLVVVLVAEDREPIAIAPAGYTYARYVGIDLAPIATAGQEVRITAATISPMPKSMFDPMPSVTVTLSDGSAKTLFSFYPDEISFTETEFVGLTVQEAMSLRQAKDVSFLRS